MKELCGSMSRIALMSLPQNPVLARVLYAGTFLVASPSAMRSDVQNTVLRLLHQYLYKSE